MPSTSAVLWLIEAVAIVLAVWLAVEVIVRTAVGWTRATDFYGSIPRDAVRERQQRHGVKAAGGRGWAHLGWIADPEREAYRIEREGGSGWEIDGRARLGSYLLRSGGRYRVWAEPVDGSEARLLGAADAEPEPGQTPICVPRIAGSWQVLFAPSVAGDYVNDHTIYRDADGRWRLIGITAKGRGNYADEKHFAVGVSSDFPPESGMKEDAPAADFGELAWAPHVIAETGGYFMFWSPHRLQRMTSSDGIHWGDRRTVIARPAHKFFRDAMVSRVADGQWLLYSTGRGRYFSRVDVYQSFDLEGWQYIGTALRTGFGSERNGIVASTESPSVVCYREHFYLSVTYNNDSFFWPVLLLPLRIWIGRDSYNDTLIFHSDNPYDFGTYRGRHRPSSLLTRLEAHAPEYVHHPERDEWYVTTAGWPWVATLTSGEAAVAPLSWEQAPRQHWA